MTSCSLRLELTDGEAKELSDWVAQETRRPPDYRGPNGPATSASDYGRLVEKIRAALKDAGVVVP
jgi:hypothetical protein